MTTKLKKALQPKLDQMYAECKARMAEMESQSEHPQIALCIEKNRGYAMALEDVVELLYSLKAF